MSAMTIVVSEEKTILIRNQFCYLVMASYNLPDNIFHVSQNNFKGEHDPPDGERFDMIKKRDCVKDVP